MTIARIVGASVLLAGLAGCGAADQPTGPVPVLSGAAAAKVKSAKWESIVVATQNTCGIIKGGAAYCWGSNNFGNLGDGTTDFFSAVPRPVAGGHSFRKIAHLYTHGCGVTNGNEAWCWGANDRGQLGDGTFTESRVPVRVAGYPFNEIAVSAFHTCALNGGQAFCWGDNAAGNLGIADVRVPHSSVPLPVVNLSPVFEVPTGFRPLRFYSLVGGGTSTCGLSEGLTASLRPSGTPGPWKCWGSNFDRTFAYLGEPSIPIPDASYEPVPAFNQPVLGSPSGSLVPASIRIQRFYGTACVVAEVGVVLAIPQPFCWGKNANGQTGTGATSPHIIQPTRVATTLQFKSISAGENHSCALTPRGDAYCWGANERGQLGTNDLTSNLTPVPVAAGGLRFDQIMAGNRYTCAITSQGAAYCWGRNELGELGDGSTVDRLVPTAVLDP